MKTKTEIKNKIKRIRQIKKTSYDKNLKQCLDSQILALKWVLNYKTGDYYWCYNCELSHKHLKCPKCGNETLAGNSR